MANEKIEILKLLIGNKETDFSIRKLSKLRKINYKSAYNAVKYLKNQNLLTIKELGNISIPKFNNNFSPLVYEVEEERLNEFLKNKTFKVIYNMFSEINEQFILILFGSHVKDTTHKHSDIDFLIISENLVEIEQKASLISNFADFT